MGTDCKSVGESLRRFESCTPHQSSKYGTFSAGFVPKNLLDTGKHGTNESELPNKVNDRVIHVV